MPTAPADMEILTLGDNRARAISVVVRFVVPPVISPTGLMLRFRRLTWSMALNVNTLVLKLLLASALVVPAAKAAAVDLIQANGNGSGATVGSVTVERNGGTLTVTLATNPEYLVVEAHAAAALSCDDIPQNRGGNPNVGKFEASWTSAGFPGSSEIPLILDATDFPLYGEVCVAAHAVVYDQAGGDTDEDAFFNTAESAWADGDRFPGQSWATHFTFESIEPPTGCNTAASCTVFRTSVTGLTGDLVSEAESLGLSPSNGLDAGDQICQRLADDAGIGGARVYRAWLSDSANSPSTRFNQATVPYQDATGTTIADDWGDLTDGTIAATLTRDEYGVNFGGGSYHAWTGTLQDGTADVGFACQDWTSADVADTGRTGRWANTDFQWTESGRFVCDGSFRTSYLLCFEQ